MRAALKSIPLLSRILLGSLFISGLYGLSHRHPTQRVDISRQAPSQNWERQAAASEYPGLDGASSRLGSGDGEQAQQDLVLFKAQQAQLQQSVQACMADMNQAAHRMALAAMNGQLAGQAPCAQSMPQWTAEEAYLETEIYRLQTGDTRSTVRQITGVQMGFAGEGASPSHRPSSLENDGGIDAVERYDRQAVRGTSLYREEDGTPHELPTQSYYFRDRSSGQIISSNLPEPPSNGRDYDPVNSQE